MAKKIIDIMHDSELRERLGNAGREMAAKYKLENVSAEWNNFIRNICEENEED